ncbi:c-type cytochrome [uncultured Tepidimonas sp.]|uniref:c-type cytochrome n=1 Tax=uncultured Tepidimonas sp. TaxID=453579 RepID=UPI002612B19D|nr:c-type cytochrome [uncultured Tepidimonas sp.]
MNALRTILVASALGAATLAHAQVDQVKVWAAACANCHGTDGRAEPGMEALAGKNADDMTKTLLDFKAGRKPATIMHQISKGYTDDELRAIAAYFAAQKK